MVHIAGPDPLITCPFDESHRILKSRMQFHMVRCSKNHDMSTRMKCPWNPLHIIDKFSYKNHYTRECEDMPGAAMFLCPPDNGIRYDVGSVPVGATNDLMPPTDEDWDAEPYTGTYDPVKNAESKPVLRVCVGLSKAKKKAWRLAERKRFQELEANGPIQIPSRPAPKLDKPLPPVRKIGKALSMIDTSDNDSDHDKTNSATNKTNPRRLRNPHEPSSALSYKENLSKIDNDEQQKTIHGSGKISMPSENESVTVDEIPKLCQMLDDSFLDANSKKINGNSKKINGNSKKTNGNSSINVDDRREILDKGMEMRNIPSTAGCSYYEDENSCLAEAANLPNLVAPIENPNDETIFALKQELAKLTNEQMRLDNRKSQLIRQISDYNEVPNLVSSNASVCSYNPHEDSTVNAPLNSQHDFPPIQRKQNSQGGIPKCAANFSKFGRVGKQTMVGNDCGLEINRDLGGRGGTGAKKEEIKEERKNARPRSYRAVVIRSDEDDSASAYEKSD